MSDSDFSPAKIVRVVDISHDNTKDKLLITAMQFRNSKGIAMHHRYKYSADKFPLNSPRSPFGNFKYYPGSPFLKKINSKPSSRTIILNDCKIRLYFTSGCLELKFRISGCI